MKRKNPIKGHRAVEWPDTIRRAARFCIEPKRFLPFFTTDVLVLTVAFLLMGSVVLPYGGIATGTLPPEVMSVMGGLAALFIAWFLVSLWIMGAVIHQSSKPKDLDESWLISTQRYPSLLAATVVVGVISFLASAVPVFGLMLVIIASLAFLLVGQFVVVEGTGFYEALQKSVLALRYKFNAVFLAWLVGGVLTCIIMFLFALPLISTVLYFAAQYGFEDAMLYMLVSLDWNVIYVESGILLLGISVSRTFLLHFLTDVYLQLNKKRFFIF